MTRRYTIRQVAKATGLEESEIRFYEQVFREFLSFSQLDLDKSEFTLDHIDILKIDIRKVLRWTSLRAAYDEPYR